MNNSGGDFNEKNSSSGQLEWHFSQVFGERTAGEDVQDADIISAVEFDHTGEYLATGDHGGRVVLFERIASKPSILETNPDHRALSPHQFNPYEYRYLTEFQSHDPEFDYLKSVEIEEKINRVRWLRRWQGSGALSLLTTNDKTIKLWKVYEKQLTCLSEFNLKNNSSNHNRAASFTSLNTFGSPDKLAGISAITGRASSKGDASILSVPKVEATETILASKCRRVYSSAHTYHINAISLSADQETFISADDLRINLWHLDRSDTSFNIVDIKPSSMEDLTEVITCADFHPHAGHVFAYASSKGCIRLVDMRQSALCDNHAKLFAAEEPVGTRNFFTEIVTSINDVKFLGPDGTTLLSRDYMTLRVWDIRNESAPLASYPIHESLRGRLSDLYESDAIFDKFDVCASGDGKHYATGTYTNFLRIVPEGSTGPTPGTLLEASRDPTRRRLAGSSRLPSRFVGFGRAPARDRSSINGGVVHNGGGGGSGFGAETALCSDLNTKIQHLSWHPTSNVIAASAQNSLYLFYGCDNRHASLTGSIGSMFRS